MDPTLVSFLSQLPVVGIFVWFCLRLIKDARTERTDRDAKWRAFFKEERDRRTQNMDKGLTKLEALTKEIHLLAGNLTKPS